ncbi:MAG: dTDP-4-dehydrorhamnose reductase, partial [Jaaginema sp. PMC 1080.18]|nr:dTDP-4-dehydrorhamnose reductase [Jaaginema sp. PMC 1080.18]
MKILITGANGQLGQDLQRRFAAENAEIVALDRQNLDIADPQAVRDSIAHHNPNILINAGAYTAVDKAESEPDLAYAANTTAPKILAEAAATQNVTFVHISTDYVFDGKQSTPYQETDPTNPIGVYGKSKRDGEIAIAQVGQTQDLRYCILRTAWVYGNYGKGNFVKTMLRLGAQREELRVVADQIGTPTWTYDIADAIAQLLSSPDWENGIYHFTNSGAASWYDFAIAIFEEAQALKIPLTLQNVVPITTP